MSFEGFTNPEEIKDIRSVGELGQFGDPHRLQLYSSYRGLPQLPLYREHDLPADVVREHYEVHEPVDVNVYGLPGFELGSVGLLQKGGQVFLNRDVFPTYFKRCFTDSEPKLGVWAGSFFNSEARVIDVDYPLATALHPNLVYGHFLIEILPRLHLLKQLQQMGVEFKLALPIALQPWVMRIVASYFDEVDIFRYDARMERVRSPCIIAPGMMHRSDYHFHPQLNCVVEEFRRGVLSEKEPINDGARLYLSRRRLNGSWHEILNEGEVEEAVISLGFTVIHPQEMELRAQMASYAAASCIVTEFSSAAHNSLFADRGTKVFCINRINWYQSRIAQLRSQKIAYFPAHDGTFRDWTLQGRPEARFVVNCSELRSSLSEFLLS